MNPEVFKYEFWNIYIKFLIEFWSIQKLNKNIVFFFLHLEIFPLSFKYFNVFTLFVLELYLLILRYYLTADRRYDDKVKNQEIIEMKELLQNRGRSHITLTKSKSKIINTCVDKLWKPQWSRITATSLDVWGTQST